MRLKCVATSRSPGCGQRIDDLETLKPYFRRSSGGSSSSCLASAAHSPRHSSLSGFAFGCCSSRCSRRSEQPRQLGDVRRDPPCLVAGQTDSSPSMAGMALLMPVNRAGAVEYEIDENNGIKA
jgi:hypothetical protein